VRRRKPIDDELRRLLSSTGFADFCEEYADKLGKRGKRGRSDMKQAACRDAVIFIKEWDHILEANPILNRTMKIGGKSIRGRDEALSNLVSAWASYERLTGWMKDNLQEYAEEIRLLKCSIEHRNIPKKVWLFTDNYAIPKTQEEVLLAILIACRKLEAGAITPGRPFRVNECVKDSTMPELTAILASFKEIECCGPKPKATIPYTIRISTCIYDRVVECANRLDVSQSDVLRAALSGQFTNEASRVCQAYRADKRQCVYSDRTQRHNQSVQRKRMRSRT